MQRTRQPSQRLLRRYVLPLLPGCFSGRGAAVIVWCNECDTPIAYTYGGLRYPHYRSTDPRPTCLGCSIRLLDQAKGEES